METYIHTKLSSADARWCPDRFALVVLVPSSHTASLYDLEGMVFATSTAARLRIQRDVEVLEWLKGDG